MSNARRPWTWGNISSRGSVSSGAGVGCEVLVVDFIVEFDGKFGASGLIFEVDAGTDRSLASNRSVSAATIPPIEWPTRIV